MLVAPVRLAPRRQAANGAPTKAMAVRKGAQVAVAAGAARRLPAMAMAPVITVNRVVHARLTAAAVRVAVVAQL